MRFRCSRGQASVELVALLPLIAVGLAAVVQVVLVGHAAWALSQAASAAGRAHAVGARPLPAARRALPAHLDAGLRVWPEAGHVRLSLRVPSPVPGLSVGTLRARGGFASQETGA